MPEQVTRQLRPFWLEHEYSEEKELQLFAEPRHSFESEPDQLHPSCCRHAEALRYDPHDRAEPPQRPLLEQSRPHRVEERAEHAVGVP